MEHSAPIPPGRTAYRWHGCRCADCREWEAIYHRNRRWLPWRAMKRPLNHGKVSTYVNYRCRCLQCSAARHEYRAQWYRAVELPRREEVAA